MPRPNIDVGHNGDCGFESIAARLIDLHRNKKLKGTELDDFLNVYRFYFPKELPTLSNEKAFDHLVETISPRQLVKNMAFALRQCAVNRIISHPEKYPGAFADKTEGTKPSDMRKPGTWIDGSALAAIADGLNIAIVIHCGNADIPIYDKDKPRECKEEINITLSGGHYQPFVSDPDYFTQRTSTLTNNLPNVKSHDPTMEEINEKIRKAEIVDNKRETDAYKILNESSTNHLIELYQKMMPKSDYLPNRIAIVTEEYKGDLFFFKAINDNEIDSTKEAALRKELLHALGKQAYIDKDFYKQQVLKMKDEEEPRRRMAP